MRRLNGGRLRVGEIFMLTAIAVLLAAGNHMNWDIPGTGIAAAAALADSGAVNGEVNGADADDGEYASPADGAFVTYDNADNDTEKEEKDESNPMIVFLGGFGVVILIMLTLVLMSKKHKTEVTKYKSELEAIKERLGKLDEMELTNLERLIAKKKIESGEDNGETIPKTETDILERLEPVKFPHIIECPACDAKIRVSQVGKFRCPMCEEINLMDESGSIVGGAKAARGTEEPIDFPCTVHCPNCLSSVTVERVGKFRCRGCKELCEIDEYGTVVTNKRGR